MDHTECYAILMYMLTCLHYIPQNASSIVNSACNGSIVSFQGMQFRTHPCRNERIKKKKICFYHKHVSVLFNQIYHDPESREENFYAFLLRFLHSKLIFGSIDKCHAKWMCRPDSIMAITRYIFHSGKCVIEDEELYNYILLLFSDYFHFLQNGDCINLDASWVKTEMKNFVSMLVESSIFPPMEVEGIVL